MAVAPTNAALVMEENVNELTAHQVISLLLNGALERVSQAKACIRDGNEQDKVLLVQKILGIINGLRESLNMEAGGEIAVNLDSLYSYMTERLQTCQEKEEMLALTEVGKLIENVRQGWDGISVANAE
ncbi:flagellar export chaperone FliS [Teredinibacter turnerae]|uniref:Flagellar secretion chaperone FliS n=1 Tax=Teredinibacter turnerae (strain ATCC 39867 / T7901) TaxID=377629 RepID=C5BRZ6_TERTT|nr:flagellar export chaperone FliS [Teredinibacter turnerae]ACR13224.1 flagellar protein FliS [Teredinibacter turnerae T7901]